jgi:hypothetical protein
MVCFWASHFPNLHLQDDVAASCQCTTSSPSGRSYRCTNPRSSAPGCSQSTPKVHRAHRSCSTRPVLRLVALRLGRQLHAMMRNHRLLLPYWLSLRSSPLAFSRLTSLKQCPTLTLELTSLLPKYACVRRKDGVDPGGRQACLCFVFASLKLRRSNAASDRFTLTLSLTQDRLSERTDLPDWSSSASPCQHQGG